MAPPGGLFFCGEPVTDTIEQLRHAIRQSGLSSSAYARQVLVREPRTIRRWLAGQSPIPAAVVAFLNAHQNETVCQKDTSAEQEAPAVSSNPAN